MGSLARSWQHASLGSMEVAAGMAVASGATDWVAVAWALARVGAGGAGWAGVILGPATLAAVPVEVQAEMVATSGEGELAVEETGAAVMEEADVHCTCTCVRLLRTCSRLRWACTGNYC